MKCQLQSLSKSAFLRSIQPPANAGARVARE